jgi:hypothetical protein
MSLKILIPNADKGILDRAAELAGQLEEKLRSTNGAISHAKLYDLFEKTTAILSGFSLPETKDTRLGPRIRFVSQANLATISAVKRALAHLENCIKINEESSGLKTEDLYALFVLLKNYEPRIKVNYPGFGSGMLEDQRRLFYDLAKQLTNAEIDKQHWFAGAYFVKKKEIFGDYSGVIAELVLLAALSDFKNMLNWPVTALLHKDANSFLMSDVGNIEEVTQEELDGQFNKYMALSVEALEATLKNIKQLEYVAEKLSLSHNFEIVESLLLIVIEAFGMLDAKTLSKYCAIEYSSLIETLSKCQELKLVARKPASASLNVEPNAPVYGATDLLTETIRSLEA